MLRRDDAVATPSRHLGLVPVAERTPEAVATVERLGALVERTCDVDALLALARTAPALSAQAWSPSPTYGHCPPRAGSGDTSREGTRPVVAVFGGPAFTFSYAETTELLTAAGADVVTVDPLRDERLPDATAGLVIGGGFPEVYAEQLSANAPLRDDVARLAATGAPVSAECAGLLYLCERLDDLPMCGVLPATAQMTPRLTLGYRETKAATASWMSGDPVVGHEFHRTTVDPVGGVPAAWANGEGFVQGGVHASYLHLHWAGVPGAAERFVQACG